MELVKWAINAHTECRSNHIDGYRVENKYLIPSSYAFIYLIFVNGIVVEWDTQLYEDNWGATWLKSNEHV